jgi:5'-3' exonuclease
MDFIRERRSSYPDYAPNELHSLYGLVTLRVTPGCGAQRAVCECVAEVEFPRMPT